MEDIIKGEKAMQVKKRDGRIVEFDKQKIVNAIMKAMKYGSGIIKPNIANKIADEIEQSINNNATIFEIETMVFDKLISHKQRLTAKAYENYRVMREYQRKTNTIDNKILGLINGDNKESLQSNSNKQSKLISTQRDLVAEEVSKDISLRMKLPPHIAQAHNEGLIYIHDLGHYLNPSFNCELINLKDMLENGTVINGKMVEKPHSFRTACTIATQIVAQVASGQFGGQTISLAHLAPFVRISEENIRKTVTEEIKTILNSNGGQNDLQHEQTVEKIVKQRLAKEIKDGIQTFQYQINTLQTSNGQAPFLSVFMYINEYPEYEKETVMLIEEMLKQRIEGMKNEVGIYITPAFPKLLYVTDENNIHNDSKYYWLTQLACKCVSKRMLPDFLSAKILKQNYEGNIVPPMGKRNLAHIKLS